MDVLGIVVGVASGAALTMIYQARRRARLTQPNETWDSIRLDRFASLDRLVQNRDLAHLRSLPGFDKRLAARLESGRRRVLRLYINEAHQSFGKLFQVGLDYALNDPTAPEDLAGSLLTMKRKLALAVPTINAYLICRDLGIPVPAPRRALQMLEIAPMVLGSTPAVARVSAF